MCLCTTVFIKIRCYTELLFEKFEDEWERIKTFSSPKIMRFAEILEKFKPPDVKNQILKSDSGNIPMDIKDDDTVSGCDSINKESINKMLKDIEECDFTSLGNKIQDRVNTYESNLKDLESPTDDNSTSLHNPDSPKTDTENKTDSSASTPNIPSNTSVHETDTTDIAEYSVSKTDTTDKAEYSVSKTDTRVSGMDCRGNEIIVQQRGLIGFTRRSGYRLRYTVFFSIILYVLFKNGT